MRTATEFPNEVVEQPDVGIIMPDGCRLSVRLWMPVNALAQPLPAIVEHLPYRKRDGTVARDEQMHPWFAGHGYACLRVDMRGNGDSQGLMDDEYTDQEWQDACTVIAWASAQPWCNGQVGMMGISWGGFNALQVAALQPPALKAIITVCSTVDRFADDIHYKGGCLLTENIGWAANMLSYSSRPPDKALVGEGWRSMWLARLTHLPFLGPTWHRHQARDRYWQRGSVCENYAAIDAAVLAVGGWHDGYRNTVSHLVAHCTAPVKGIVGPWIHKYPHYAAPQPAIGFLQEALRWWDHYLKGDNTGVEQDPAYRVWLMDSLAPARWLPERPGHWIGERIWPSPNIRETVYYLGPRLAERHVKLSTLGAGSLLQELTEDQATDELAVMIASPQDCGAASGEYFPFAFGPELPDEQTCDDERSACFDSDVLGSTMDIVGAPIIELAVSADQPYGLICVRLCEVHPGGDSALLSMGLLNLRHRNSAEQPSPVVPGQIMHVKVVLDQMACRVSVGNRLRVSISNSYWPFVWPSPGKVELCLLSGSLRLPVRSASVDEISFEAPEASAAWAAETLRKPSSTRSTTRDAVTGVVTTRIVNDFGENRDYRHGLVSGSLTQEQWSVHPEDPLSAQAAISWQQRGGRDDWWWSTDVQVSMYCDARAFYLRAELQAFEGDTEVFSREFTDVIAREHV